MKFKINLFFFGTSVTGIKLKPDTGLIARIKFSLQSIPNVCIVGRASIFNLKLLVKFL